MIEAFALNMRGVSGYLVTTSGRRLEQIDVDAVMEVEVSSITAGHSVEENYRPGLVIEGMAKRLSGAFGEGISEVALDEGIAVVLDYALSDEEIGRLSEKGFFHKDFPFKLSADNMIRVPHRMTCMVFNDADVPIIVVDPKEEGMISCDSDVISDTPVLDCMENYTAAPKHENSPTSPLFEEQPEVLSVRFEEKTAQKEDDNEETVANKDEMNRQIMAEEIIENMTRDVQTGDVQPEWAHDADIFQDAGHPAEEQGVEDVQSSGKGLPDVSAFGNEGEDYEESFQ